MKRIVSVIIGILLAFIVSLAMLFIHLERTEWTMRSETTDISIPLKTDRKTLAEIEAQTKQEALQRYPDAYLNEITWVVSTNEGFERLTDGKVEITYCTNLGNAKGFYNYNRYAFCRMCVDLQQKKLQKSKHSGIFNLVANRNSKYIQNLMKYVMRCTDILILLKHYRKVIRLKSAMCPFDTEV